jgi:hypothetical protein
MTTATAHLADSEHPWIGLASFTEGDREFFAGRGEEIDELLRLVRRDILTLLYGISGLGKTSLLQAGLFPALRAEDCLPVPVRLDYLEGAPPLSTQVLGAITAAADAAVPRVEAPQPTPDEKLWEYLHREGNHFWSSHNELVTPFLAFDQFEELFTLGRETPERAARTKAFISELADLVENRPPAALRDDPLRAKQFSFKPVPLKVLLAMREDYLADLDRIRSHFRALGQNRLRLLPMGGQQARQVIALGAPLLAPSVEDRILKFVAGGADDDAEITIAPALLSLVLRELNERRLAGAPGAKITPDLLGVEQQKIFENFYLKSIRDFPGGVRTFIEDKLLTTSGYRKSCALDDALSCPDVTQPILNELVNRRLLAYEDRHHTRWMELTHDVLIPVIKASRDTRLTREALEKAEQQKRRLLVVTVLLMLAVAGAIYGWFEATRARNAQRLAEENLSKYKEEQTRSQSLSRQKQEALLTAGKLSDSLKDLAVIALEDKDNSVQIVSPLFKNLLLNYIKTVEEKTLNDHDLPPEVELNLRLSRVTVDLMTRDLDRALQECDDVLAQLPRLPVQDPTYQAAFFRLKGDILDEKAFRERFSPRNDRKAEWIRAIQCFQHAADSCDFGSDDGRLLLATLQVRIGHVVDYLSKTYCPGKFGETNESSKETESAKEPLAAAPDPTAFLDFNRQAFERINAALGIVKRFVLTHPNDVEGLRAEADAQNKLGNVAKERYQSGFVADAADMHQLMDTAIKRYNEALATRETLLRMKNASPSDQVAVALIQANLGETYGLPIEQDLHRTETNKYLDSRIETCDQLLKIDRSNPYFKSILRRGCLNKINFLVETVKTPAARSEANDLLSYTLYLDPETIREEDLANLEQLCDSLGLQTQWQTCLTARQRLLQLKSNP